MLAAGSLAAAELACPPRAFRWQEDCSTIARTDASLGWLRLRGIPLSDDASSWLTLGGEYRFRVETLEDPSFGLRGEAYTAHDQRWFAHADLHAPAGVRVFVQLSAAADNGREPAARPFDHSALDIAQAFLDLPLQVGDSKLLLRLGRQELDLHSNRLVSTREAANLRRAFDTAMTTFTHGRLSALAFVGRPVRNSAGAFDDHRDPAERFAGGSLELVAGANDSNTLTLVYLDRERPRAIFQDAVGTDQRRTYVVRVARATAALDLALQAAYQQGDLDGKRVRARGLAGDVGFHPIGRAWQPRFGVSFGYASGDPKSGDDSLGTFDVLYPNLGYFTDAPVFYPGNTADIQPNISAHPTAALTLQTGCDFIRRIEKSDAIYEPPGIPLVAGDGTGSHTAATLCFGKVLWRPIPNVELTAAYVYAQPRSVLRDAGGISTDYWLMQLALRL
jgi:hypothetical protein